MTTTTASLSDELNNRIDCEDLAIDLGLKRHGEKGNFYSPHHADKSPSLSVFRDKSGDSRWKDFSGDDDAKGRAVGLYMYVKHCDAGTAVRELSDKYGIKMPSAQPAAGPVRERSKAEWIGDNCVAAARTDTGREKLMSYLTGRGISSSVVEHAMQRRTLGLNTWSSPTIAAGEPMHGGEAAAFLVRQHDTGQVVGVDMRYLDPTLNGGMKTQSQGDKESAPWCSDWRRFQAAHTIFVCESSINAMSVETANIPGWAAISIRGTGTVESMPWRLLIGKRAVLGLDNDKPREDGPMAGYCPGLKAAWAVHEALVALDVPALLVDQGDWLDDKAQPINDLNDYLQLKGPALLAHALKQLEPWLIPGMRGRGAQGKPRVWLPKHDYDVYWRFQVRDDFTSHVDKYKRDQETGKISDLETSDVCGFRVAAISRITIAGHISFTTGEKDTSPKTAFAVSAQVPRHPDRLRREVVADKNLHNIEMWKQIGPVWNPRALLRIVNIFERATHIGSRDAVNFVGVAWRNGVLAVIEGPDTYFPQPERQCPYSDFLFPSGPVRDAATVIAAYQVTFAQNAALIPLVWVLGAHLKVLLGFWPHFKMEAGKGSGKDKLTGRMARSLGMKFFSGLTMETQWRRLASVSNTSQPVGWMEISARKKEVLSDATRMLQEAYQFSVAPRGMDLVTYLMSAPVMLVGEDSLSEGIEGKLVRSTLSIAKQGTEIPHDLPAFPVRQWLDYICASDPARVRDLHAECLTVLQRNCIADAKDPSARRTLTNYAALRCAWVLLCSFADIPIETGDFLRDLAAEMNAHIRETSASRHPWVWIVDTLLSEIARGTFKYPFVFTTIDEEPVLAVRTSHVMHHLARENSLREFYDSLPLKSDRAFKRALAEAEVVAEDDIERTVQGKRVSHMVALSLPALERYQLYATQPVAAAED